MPVEDRPVHEKTRLQKDSRYGCFNRGQLKDHYFAKDGLKLIEDPDSPGEMIAVQKMTRVDVDFYPDCPHVMSLQDERCEGCNRRGEGEEHTTGASQLAGKPRVCAK